MEKNFRPLAITRYQKELVVIVDPLQANFSA